MIEALVKQGFRAKKVSDRFKAGPPDLRLGRSDLGQLDVELKYNNFPAISDAVTIDSGMTKLQWLTIRDMNEHGMPAVCLVYFECLNQFVMTTDRILRNPLTGGYPMLSKLPQSRVIDGAQLFSVAREFLNG